MSLRIGQRSPIMFKVFYNWMRLLCTDFIVIIMKITPYLLFVVFLSGFLFAHQWDNIERHLSDEFVWDPEVDPIPYNPETNIHGDNYEIPQVPWKIEADERINTYRKAGLSLTIVDTDGDALEGIPVRVELLKHSFHWGGVMGREFLTSPATAKLQDYFLKYFNSSGSENGLKPKQRPLEAYPTQNTAAYYTAVEQFEWFRAHDIPTRGHALSWEGENFIARDLQDVYQDSALSDFQKGEKMLELQFEHLVHSMNAWDVFCWDVVNEPRVNHLINDLLPDVNTFVETFRKAAETREGLCNPPMLFYNENQVASFVHYWNNYDDYKDVYKGRIQEIIDADVPIDGIGFQYRFRRYVDPETVYQRLRDYEEFNLPFQATEFEVKPMNDAESFSVYERKKMTAELLTIFFSHPNSTGLWHWTFVDRASGSHPWALFSYTGELRPEAEQWIKMMEEDFNTDEVLTTSADGKIHLRAFKGIYKVTVGEGAQAQTYRSHVQDETHQRLIYQPSESEAL